MIVEQSNEPRFFLGGNSKTGFFSLFGQLQEPDAMEHAYILKGGPGSGKSTLMRRLGSALAARGHSMEWIPCASDPDSLDAVIDHSTRRAVLDGTAPHISDPVHPGAVATLMNAGDAWDEAELRANRAGIVSSTAQVGACHGRAGANIRAAAVLLDDNRELAAEYVDRQAVASRAGEILKEVPASDRGRETKRLLSAVSVGKVAFFQETLQNLCEKLYTVTDDWGAGSHALLERLRTGALEKGADVITCFCSIGAGSKIDHLIFPQARLGVSTVNRFHAAGHANAVCLEELYRPVPTWLRELLAAQCLTAGGLIERACGYVREAKTLHDGLEQYYVKAMTFSQMDALYDRLLERMAE